MTFIIKFIPLIKGISIIHVYSQKKLSRMNENTEQQQIKYREVDLLYGSEIRTNLNLEFRYTQPKVLQHIEKFLIEFCFHKLFSFIILNSSSSFVYSDRSGIVVVYITSTLSPI